eukprot:237922_1
MFRTVALRVDFTRLVYINQSFSTIYKICKYGNHVKPLQINQNLLRKFDVETDWNWYRPKDSLLHDTLKNNFQIQQAKGSETYHEMEVKFNANKGLSGHPNTVHGGFVAAALGESMGVLACKFIHDSVIMASLETKYLIPLQVGYGTITVKIDENNTNISKRKIYVESQIRNNNGEITTIGKGLYIQTGPETNQISAQLTKEYNQQKRIDIFKHSLLIGLVCGNVTTIIFNLKRWIGRKF